MSERRRFFPSRRVQREIGQRVAVEVQLRPEGPAPKLEAAPAPEAPPPPPPPPPPSACAIIGAGWLEKGVGNLFEQLPDGQTRFWADWGGLESRWTGTPGHHDAGGNPLPIPAEQFHCHHLKTSYYTIGQGLHAVLQGAALSDAMWTFQWEGAQIGEPHAPSNINYSGTITVSTWGNVLQVVGNDVSYDGTDMTFRLTAWAHCGGEQVAEITLDIYFPGH